MDKILDIINGSLSEIFGGVVVVVLVFIATYLYKGFYSSIAKEQLSRVSKEFYSMVKGLSSKNMAEKIASAILLRRFFDKKSEMGIGELPYEKEAINVISGLLKYEKTSNFQKILGDGLSYASSLSGADLQRTNLQNVYITAKSNDKLDISRADFFEADLSGALFQNVDAKEVVFYNARLYSTVFKDCDLTGANFVSSDLKDIRFKENVILKGANFANAINIPDAVLYHLDKDGKYEEKKKDKKVYKTKNKKSIFIALPGILSDEQKAVYECVKTSLSTEDIVINILERENYQEFGITTNIKHLIDKSDGVVAFQPRSTVAEFVQ